MKKFILTLAILAGTYSVSAIENTSLKNNDSLNIDDTSCTKTTTYTSDDGLTTYTWTEPC